MLEPHSSHPPPHVFQVCSGCRLDSPPLSKGRVRKESIVGQLEAINSSKLVYARKESIQLGGQSLTKAKTDTPFNTTQVLITFSKVVGPGLSNLPKKAPRADPQGSTLGEYHRVQKKSLRLYIFHRTRSKHNTCSLARSLSLQPTSCISSRPNSTLIIQICKPLSNVIHILSVKVSTHMRVTQADCSLHLCFLVLLRHFHTTQVRDPVYKKMQ